MGTTATEIKAITFDLWDTLVVDNSDEEERRRRGLRSKREERRYLTWEALNRHGEISLADVTLAFDTLDAAFNEMWHEQHVTWPIGQRFRVLFRGLGRELPTAELETLVARQARMEVEIPPRVIPGAHAALEQLAGRYRLGIVSDAVFTPGSCLREILAKHRLAHYFRTMIFSDEAGRSKPHRRVFETAAKALGVSVHEMLHIGDRQHNDIAGPQAVGMKAILFTASRTVDRDRHTADAHCETFDDLPDIIEQLAE